MGTVGTLADRLKGERYLTLETTPPHDPVLDPMIDKIERLGLEKKVDGFSTTDNPLAKLKYDSILAAVKLQQRLGRPVIATMSMRDRNRIALQSQLLAANDFDVRHILALTGDPAHLSDQPHAKGVFEGDSTMLLDMIRCLNSGIDFAGHPFKTAPKTVMPFAVSNSYAKNFSHIGKKMGRKIKNGAVGIITQPVFGVDNARMLIETFDAARGQFNDERRDAQLILGIFPVSRLRTAQFLASHVPGIHVPDVWIEKLTKATAKGDAEEAKVGIELSRQLLRDIRTVHPKIHLMTANRFELAQELLADL